MFLLIAGLALLVFLLYKVVVGPIIFWEKLGVPHTEWMKFFSINWLIFFKGLSAAQVMQEMYNAVPKKRYHGFHHFNHPNLLVKDPELFKQITIKDFDHFADRRFAFSAESDPLFGKTLLHMKGQKWRVMRGVFSASFTANKMKLLFQIMDNCGKNFIRHFLEKESHLVEVDMQDAFSRYTNDVIAASVFGAEVDSLKDPNNELYLQGKEASNLSKFPINMKFVLSVTMPRMYELLGLRLLPRETNDFFINLVNESIRLREEGKIVQTDMMQLLIETKKEYEAQQQEEADKGELQTKITITNEDVISQAFIFFFAGFESVARSLCFMAYELAVHPDVQKKLREEIENVNKNCKQITYDILMGMKYLDMVTSEVLRLHPVQIASDRVCTKPYTIEPVTKEEKPAHIPVGTLVFLPIYALHNDPQYFPNPAKFDPKRFSEENKAEIKPYTYRPFGTGPRMCIGSRFALMKIKLLFFYILSTFEIVPIEKTKIPLVYKKMFSLTSENGFWLGLKKV